jgi:hypothetical protein
MTESNRLRFDLYFWGALTVVLVGTGVYFSFHLAWNLIVLSFLLVYFGAISAVAGFYRTWRKSRFGSRPLVNDSVQNPKVRVYRFIMWALLMCIAGLITAHFAPHKVVFVPGLFLVLFVPMVLIPTHNSGRENSPIMRSGTSATSKIGIEVLFKLLWVAGSCLWCSMVLFLWWHGYEAQTAAQASLNITRLGMISGIGILWSVAGAAWLAKHRKTRKT